MNGGYVCVPYKNLHFGTINITGSYVTVKENRFLHRDLNDKMAVFHTQFNYASVSGLKSRLRGGIFAMKGKQINSLFISRHCRLNRELFRSSGYKIVRDPDNADVIVVPDMNQLCKKQRTYVFDVMATRDGDCFLFSIYEGSLNVGKYGQYDRDLVKHGLAADNYEVVSDLARTKCECQIVPNYDEYRAMLESPDDGRLYRSELSVPLKTSTVITPEVLHIWSCSTDLKLLSSSILLSDWQRYPLTLASVLSDNKALYSITSFRNLAPGFRAVLEAIEYRSYAHGLCDYSRREIQPQDWNMLQRYALYRLGLPEAGGFIDTNNDGTCNAVTKLRMKFVVKPLFISEPMDYDNLCAMGR